MFFPPLTQLSYFSMFYLVIFSSKIMHKSTYVIVRLEVLVKNKVRCLHRILRKQRILYYHNYVNFRNWKISWHKSKQKLYIYGNVLFIEKLIFLKEDLLCHKTTKSVSPKPGISHCLFTKELSKIQYIILIYKTTLHY